MDELFETYYQEAARGRKIIEDCYGAESSQQKVILVFPDNDQEVLNAAYRYLDTFLKNYHHTSFIIISSISIDIDSIREFTKVPMEFYQISESEMNAVLRFTSFISGHYLIKVMSLKMPFNQKAEDLAGYKDITADNLVYYCLYDLLKGETNLNECR